MGQGTSRENDALDLFDVFPFFLSSGGWAKTKLLKLTTLSRIFIRVVCRFNRFNFSGVFFGSGDSDSGSCPYRRFPLPFRQRKLPLYTDAWVC